MHQRMHPFRTTYLHRLILSVIEGFIGREIPNTRDSSVRRYLALGRRICQSRSSRSRGPRLSHAILSRFHVITRWLHTYPYGTSTLHGPRERNTKVGIYFCRDSHPAAEETLARARRRERRKERGWKWPLTVGGKEFPTIFTDDQFNDGQVHVCRPYHVGVMSMLRLGRSRNEIIPLTRHDDV